MYSTCLALLLGLSRSFRLFYLIPACSGLLRHVPGRSAFTNYTTLQNVLMSMFIKKSSCSILLQSGASVLIKRGRFYVLQSRTNIITKRGSFFVLQSEASDIKTVIITKKGSTIYLVTEKLSSRILEAGFLLQLY